MGCVFGCVWRGLGECLAVLGMCWWFVSVGLIELSERVDIRIFLNGKKRYFGRVSLWDIWEVCIDILKRCLFRDIDCLVMRRYNLNRRYPFDIWTYWNGGLNRWFSVSSTYQRIVMIVWLLVNCFIEREWMWDRRLDPCGKETLVCGS